jgi:predicted nucleic acid-binding protein
MTVYVESNFVLEIALGQEQVDAAQAILNRAERGEITLALPASSLIEPFSTITHRSRRIRQLRGQLTVQLRELARSRPHQEEVVALDSLPLLLASVEARELERLTSTVG